MKPFHEEVSYTYEVVMYNVEDVADNGEMADTKKFSLSNKFNLIDIKKKVKELDYDTFEITEAQYTTKIYSVD